MKKVLSGAIPLACEDYNVVRVWPNTPRCKAGVAESGEGSRYWCFLEDDSGYCRKAYFINEILLLLSQSGLSPACKLLL